jgi:hypothetical protein
MRIKIRSKGEDKIFSTEDGDMLMIMMSKVDKERINAMSPLHFTYCVFPNGVPEEEVNSFMKSELDKWLKTQEEENKKKN